MIEEPLIDERIAAAKALASRILTGQIENEYEFILSLRDEIDKVKKLGLFSDYYENLTFDQLVLEAELTAGRKLTQEVRSAKVFADAPKEQKEELGDWLAASFKEEPDKDFLNDAQKFMQTGEFKEK